MKSLIKPVCKTGVRSGKLVSVWLHLLSVIRYTDHLRSWGVQLCEHGHGLKHVQPALAVINPLAVQMPLLS